MRIGLFVVCRVNGCFLLVLRECSDTESFEPQRLVSWGIGTSSLAHASTRHTRAYLLYDHSRISGCRKSHRSLGRMGVSYRASSRPTHAVTGTRPTCSPRSHGVSTSLSGSWRPTAGRPPVRRPAHARDGLPGAAHHDRKGGVMSSPTQVEREHPVDVAVDPRLSRGVKAFLQV